MPRPPPPLSFFSASALPIPSKQKEMDAKKAEVRARLEAQATGKKAKKGFMTPERKKKLRVSAISSSSLHRGFKLQIHQIEPF